MVVEKRQILYGSDVAARPFNMYDSADDAARLLAGGGDGGLGAADARRGAVVVRIVVAVRLETKEEDFRKLPRRLPL